MIALLTGGAGVVGKALCRELIARGVCVRVLTLPGDSLAKSLPDEVDVRYGDVTDFDSIKSAFEGVDVVYHLAAILLSTKRGAFEHVNTDGTRNVLEASKLAGVRRFLYVSSISVTYPILTPYGESKKKGEALVQASGLDWTIVRPTLVIGDGGGVEFNMFRDYVKRFPVYFMPGGGKCLKRPVRSVDLVNRNSGHGLRFDFPKMEVLAVWSMPNANADYVCLEPWHGMPGRAQDSDNFEDKPYVTLLAPGKVYTTWFTTTLI